jgi:hypothetical protein
MEIGARSFLITGACSRTHEKKTHNLSALLQKPRRISSISAPTGARQKTFGE